jgi:hypothetical protein
MLRAEYLSADTNVSTLFLREASRQMIIVRLQDYWANFVRQLVVLSASGNGHTTSGSSVASAHGLTSVRGVEAWLAPHTPPAREPDWHVAQTSLRLARLLGISNFRNVSAALGSVTSPEANIRIYRNYIVHRNKDTADRLRHLVRSNGWRPNNIALLPDIYVTGGSNCGKRGSTTFRQWPEWRPLESQQAVTRPP